MAIMPGTTETVVPSEPTLPTTSPKAAAKPVKAKAAKAKAPKAAGKKRGRPAKVKTAKADKAAAAPKSEAPAKRRGRPPGSGKKAKAAKAPKVKAAKVKAVKVKAVKVKAAKAPKAAAKGSSSLSADLKKKIAAEGLNLSAAAAAIGVAIPGLRRILAGKAKANARTMAKYEAFLGGKSAPAAKGKAATKTKVKAKRGGRRSGRPAGAVLTGGLANALALIQEALEAEAPEVEVDDLAAKVHVASKQVRAAVEAILALA